MQEEIKGGGGTLARFAPLVADFINLLSFLSTLNKPSAVHAHTHTHKEQRRCRKLQPSADWQVRHGTKD